MANKKSKTKAKSTSKMAAALNSKATTSSVTAASMAKAVSSEHMTARQLSLTFVVWLIAHSLIFYLANRFYPQAVVLGTHELSALQGLAYSMVVFTLITVGSIPVVEMIAGMQNRVLKAMDWMVIYFVINTAAIWVVARFAEQLGMGISSWMVAIVLGLIIDAVQGLLVTKAI